ncbi:MAG: hypothetical protein ACI865_002843 [Flavobacteriaceae bacterium]|jgi:hypothetical protein
MELRKQLLFTCFALFATASFSQHENEEASHDKERGIYEIIASAIYSYSPEHKEGVTGAELHFTYWFNHKWGTGLSYTAKFEDAETINEIALLGSWNPVNWMTVNIGPNIVLPTKHDGHSLGAYFETEFNIRPTKWFHFGPVLGAVYGHQFEINTGVHIGFEF